MRILKKGLIYFLSITILWVLVYRLINPPITLLMIQRCFERKLDGKTLKLKKKWCSYDKLPNNLKQAAIAGEDASFSSHWGFDFNAIQRAYQKNKQGKKIHGGSTISQQTAKNVFLWPGRSWLRKGFEVYFTILIELLWNKERILEVYLNVIETGDGIYGAEAASQAFFSKSATQLSKREAALLIAVLHNPKRWSPKKPTAYIRYKQLLILHNMQKLEKSILIQPNTYHKIKPGR